MASLTDDHPAKSRRSGPGQRRIMRTYGASFTHLPGEPADPDDSGAGGEEPPVSEG